MEVVSILALPGVVPFELGIPSRIFALARDSADRPLYDVRTCTLDGLPVQTSADFEVTVRHGREALASAGTVVIPTHSTSGPAHTDGVLTPELAAALAQLQPGARLISICTASYVLAAAGLLDDRPATTHWRHTEHFGQLFPRVRVNPDVLFVDDGDILTSAGVAAGVDLCLHVVRRDHGAEVANGVARRCIVPPWRDGGQAQYIERPFPKSPSASTASAREWALQNLRRPIRLSDLAAVAAVSVRTFTRHFQAEVGASPGAWLVRQRVELARRLLEETDLSIEAVGAEAGFGTAVSLRQHLRASIGVSPTAYRRTFRSQGAEGSDDDMSKLNS